MAANELLEEIGDCEDEVLDYIRRELESTIIVIADSMKVNSEKHKNEKLKNLRILDSSVNKNRRGSIKTC